MGTGNSLGRNSQRESRALFGIGFSVWTWKIWDLGSGFRDLCSGVWDPGSENWDLRSRIRNPGSGIWELGSRTWELGSGNWDPGSGNRDLGSRTRDLGSEIWELGSSIWDLIIGIWDLGSGIWELGSGIQDPGSGIIPTSFSLRDSPHALPGCSAAPRRSQGRHSQHSVGFGAGSLSWLLAPARVQIPTAIHGIKPQGKSGIWGIRGFWMLELSGQRLGCSAPLPVLQENPGAGGFWIPPSASVGKFLFLLIPGVIPKIQELRFPSLLENPSFLPADFWDAAHLEFREMFQNFAAALIHVIPTAGNGEIQAPNVPE